MLQIAKMHAADVQVGLIRKLEFWHHQWSVELTTMTNMMVLHLNTTHLFQSKGEFYDFHSRFRLFHLI